MKIYIKPECHAQIMHYVHKSTVEVSGLGRVQKASDGSLVVTSVYLLKQENAAASTDIDEEAMAELMYTSREDKGDLNFWWHSHVNMGVFWSGTDMKTIEDFGRKGYLLATVFNKKGEHRSAYLQGATSFLPEIFVDSIQTHFSYLPMTTEIEAWNKEFDAKCVTKVYAPASGIMTGRPTTWEEYNRKYPMDFDDTGFAMQERNADFFRHDYDPKDAAAQSGSSSKDGKPSAKASARMHLVIGTLTGFTGAEIAQEMEVLHRAAHVVTTADLDVQQMYMMFDLHEIMYGVETTSEKEAQYLLEQIIENPATYIEFLSDFWDEVARYEEVNPPAFQNKTKAVANV